MCVPCTCLAIAITLKVSFQAVLSQHFCAPSLPEAFPEPTGLHPAGWASYGTLKQHSRLPVIFPYKDTVPESLAQA